MQIHFRNILLVRGLLGALAVGTAAPFALDACTLWGAAGKEAGGGTILSKNRDWKPDHVQVLELRRDETNYTYFGLYAVGNDAEGIKQGVNEKGLSVVTATASSIPKATREAQPGRGGVMTTLLRRYANCDQILADKDKLFTNRKPSFLMISDRKKILVLEIGLGGRYAVKTVEAGVTAHSNHFLEDVMTDCNLKPGEGSAVRVARIAELLKSAPKPLDTAALAAMSRDQNAGASNSLWRTGANSRTLSSWIVETPLRGAPKLRVVIANPGQPEQTNVFVLDREFWHDTRFENRVVAEKKRVEAGAAHKTAPARAKNAVVFAPTACEGVYPGHLQGVCTDGRYVLFWSWGDTLVKTDRRGRVLRQKKVAWHHGDLCHHEGKLYVAVNLGKFNQPDGQADSWIYVYDAENLDELSRHPAPEVIHGAGGIAFHDGAFLVVGGLPEGVDENYLYEYDANLTFRKRHVLSGGHTRMGIQTAAWADGAWWFGCYGEPKILMRADESFRLSGRWEFDAALGLFSAGDGAFLVGWNTGNKKSGWRGGVVAARSDAEKGLVLADAARKGNVEIDAGFPGGNIIVEKVEGDTVTLRQDRRDTEGWWFYWHFRVRGAAGRTLAFNFSDGAPVGVRGPAVSLDEGVTWHWLGTTNTKTFSYTFPAQAASVHFAFGMSYTEAHLNSFLARYAEESALRREVLCQSRKGRPVERLHLGKPGDAPRHRVLLTCRAHCCEMMGSYVAEGVMEAVLADDADGGWFRKNVELLVIPFVDKDGVEDGDQGKNRRPRDHNRDYDGEGVYPETRAIREFVPQWAGGKLRAAIDLHCPSIRGDINQVIYLVGTENPQNWAEQQKFGEILERVCRGPLDYRAANNLPFGQKWNTVKNYGAGTSGARWASGFPGIRMATTIETPYADVSGGEVNAETARAFGHDLARALRVYLGE